MRNRILPYLALSAALLGLSACTTEPYTRVVWAHPQIPPELQTTRLKIDAQDCWKVAADAIPEPSLTQMGMRLKDRLGWQILNQREEQQEYIVAACLAQKGWRAEERVMG